MLDDAAVPANGSGHVDHLELDERRLVVRDAALQIERNGHGQRDAGARGRLQHAGTAVRHHLAHTVRPAQHLNVALLVQLQVAQQRRDVLLGYVQRLHGLLHREAVLVTGTLATHVRWGRRHREWTGGRRLVLDVGIVVVHVISPAHVLHGVHFRLVLPVVVKRPVSGCYTLCHCISNLCPYFSCKLCSHAHDTNTFCSSFRITWRSIELA